MLTRFILSFLIICFAMMSVHSQDIESKDFINNYFGKSAKLVYAEKVGEYAIESMKDALMQDTLYALDPKRREPNRRLILTQQERSYIQNQLQMQLKEVWTNDLFEKGTMVTTSELGSVYSDRGDGWPRLYRFSRPIFIRGQSLCIFYSGYSCGSRCGQWQWMVFEKKDGNWVHWIDIVKWVS